MSSPIHITKERNTWLGTTVTALSLCGCKLSFSYAVLPAGHVRAHAFWYHIDKVQLQRRHKPQLHWCEACITHGAVALLELAETEL